MLIRRASQMFFDGHPAIFGPFHRDPIAFRNSRGKRHSYHLGIVKSHSGLPGSYEHLQFHPTAAKNTSIIAVVYVVLRQLRPPQGFDLGQDRVLCKKTL